MLGAWYAMMHVKIEALDSVFAEFLKDQVLSQAAWTSAPPVVASLVYCILAVVFSCLLSAPLRCLRCLCRRTQEPDASNGPAGGEDVEAGERALPERDGNGSCSVKHPLAFSALAVVALDAAEAAFALSRFYFVGWSRAFVAGILFKWGLMCMLVHLGEGLIRFSCCGRALAPVELWVRAHRMARDIGTSSLIAAALSPLVLLTWLNDRLCPGLSLHHLLIYRNPNHLGKEEFDGQASSSWNTDHQHT